jgi:hypothetical protein
MILSVNKEEWQFLEERAKSRRNSIYLVKNVNVSKIIDELLSFSSKFKMMNKLVFDVEDMIEMVNDFKDTNTICTFYNTVITFFTPVFSFNYNGKVYDDGCLHMRIGLYDISDSVFSVRLTFVSLNVGYIICYIMSDVDNDFQLG